MADPAPRENFVVHTPAQGATAEAGMHTVAGVALDEPPSDGPPGGETAPPVPPAKPRPTRWITEAIIVILVAILVAVLLRAFVVQTFYIPSGSMEPTLQIGDRILVNKLSYHLHGVDRGDIVVFSRPPTENCGGPEVNDLVKRVIGLPGDILSASGGYVYVDGKRLNETWLPASQKGVTVAGPSGNTSNLAQPYRVPVNTYFVMGDNRTDSCDSRYWGPVAKSLIVGKVEVRVWPISSLHIF
jgi:signal peptidase I